jgi:hypothetical protein
MEAITKEYNKLSSITEVAEIAVEYKKSDTLNKENIFKSIEEFTNIENNWDGYGAIPLSLESAKNAKEFISILPEGAFQHFHDGFPNTHGTISFEWKNKKEEEFFVEIGETKMSYFLTLEGQTTIKKDLVEFSFKNLKALNLEIKKMVKLNDISQI